MVADTQEAYMPARLFEQAPAAMAVLHGPGMVFTFANPLYQEIYTRPGIQLIGKSFREVFPELEGQDVFDIFENSYATGEPFTAHEYAVSFYDNVAQALKKGYYNFVVQPIKNDTGQVTDLLVQAVEVTSQIEAQKKTILNEHRYRTLTNSLDEGFCVIEPVMENGIPVDFIFTEVNDAYERHSGRKNVVGKTIRELAPDLDETWFKSYAEVVHTGKPVRFERYNNSSGRWQEVYAWKSGGEDRCEISIMFKDVTERRRTAEALRESEEKYRSIFNFIDQGFCIIEMIFDDAQNPLDYRFLEINPGFEHHTGLVNARGKTMRELIPNHDDNWFEIYGKVALTGESKRFTNYSKPMDQWFDLYAFRTGNPAEHKVAVIFSNITDRKTATQAVEDERKNLYELFMQAPAMIVVLRGPNHIIDLANPITLQVMGLDAGIVGKPLKEAAPGVEEQGYLTMLDEVYRTGNPFIGNEMPASVDAGEGPQQRYFNFVFQPYKDAKGAMQGIMVHAVEVTRQVETHRKIAQSQQQLNAMVNQTTAGIARLDLQGNFVFVNERYAGILGREPQEVCSINVQDITHPDDLGRSAELFGGLITRGENFVIEKRYLRPDGKHVWTRNNVSLIRNEKGEPESVLAVAVDITDEKKTEVALRESEKRFRLMADHIPNPAWKADPDGNIFWYNKRWYEYTGLTEDEMPEGGWEKVHHPDHLFQVMNRIENARENVVSWEMEFPLRRYDGVYRWFLARAFPVKDENGKIIRWICTHTDIDDQKRAMEKKDEFMSIASHELKTPITSVKASLQIIQRMFNDQNFSLAKDFLAKTESHIDKMTTLINDLLDVSKIQAGKLQFNITTFRMEEIVEDCVDQVQHQTNTHKIKVQGDTSLVITGDKIRLEQVICNLLTNAIKYSPGTHEVQLAFKTVDENLHVSVTDSGIGIPADKLRNLFERFYRVQETAYQFQGLGLGLFISSEIVQRHGGKIWAESKPGEGSVFHFTIPVKSNSLHVAQAGQNANSNLF